MMRSHDSQKRRYFWHELELATGLKPQEIACLLAFDRFPKPRNKQIWGWSWNKTAVDAFYWGLQNSPKHASNIERCLG